MAEATAHDHAAMPRHERSVGSAAHADTHQQHPIRLYLVVWGWLFILSACSYMVDYFGLQGYLRWTLILIFMMLKAGLIVAVFMHMAWERLALIYAILVPPVLVLVFVADHGVRIRLHAVHALDVLRRGAVTDSCKPGVPASASSARTGGAGSLRAGRRRLPTGRAGSLRPAVLCRRRRHHDLAVEVPGGMAKHRQHDRQPGKQRHRAEDQQGRHDQAPAAIGTGFASTARTEAWMAS